MRYSNDLCLVFNRVSYIQMDAIKMLWFSMQDEGNKRKMLNQEIEHAGHKGRKKLIVGVEIGSLRQKVIFHCLCRSNKTLKSMIM